MKYLLITLLLISCGQQKPIQPVPVPISQYAIRTDTVHHHDTVYLAASCGQYDSLFKLFRAQRTELKKARFKITKAQYYLDIIDGHPEREGYIKGWLKNRALKTYTKK